MSDPLPNTPTIAPGCPETRPTPPDPWQPVLALVASRGTTLHAAVGKARGMRVAMAKRNTKTAKDTHEAT